MENINILEKDKYDEYSDYMEALKTECAIKDDVGEIVLNGNEHLITTTDDSECYSGTSYVIAYDQGNEIHIAGCKYIDKDGFSFFDDDNMYLIYPSRVERTPHDGIITDFLESYENPENPGVPIYLYSQVDAASNQALLFNYFKPEHTNDSNFLTYLCSREPDIIQFAHTRIFNHITSYKFEADYYRRYKVTKSRRGYFCPFGPKYTKDEMYEHISENGYSIKVPKDLLEVYKDESLKANNFKKTLDLYESAMKKK